MEAWIITIKSWVIYAKSFSFPRCIGCFRNHKIFTLHQIVTCVWKHPTSSLAHRLRCVPGGRWLGDRTPVLTRFTGVLHDLQPFILIFLATHSFWFCFCYQGNGGRSWKLEYWRRQSWKHDADCGKRKNRLSICSSP